MTGHSGVKRGCLHRKGRPKIRPHFEQDAAVNFCFACAQRLHPSFAPREVKWECANPLCPCAYSFTSLLRLLCQGLDPCDKLVETSSEACSIQHLIGRPH